MPFPDEKRGKIVCVNRRLINAEQCNARIAHSHELVKSSVDRYALV